MRRIGLCLTCASLMTFVIVGASTAQGQATGRVWDITYVSKDGRAVDTRRFRATPRGEIFNRSKHQIGTYTEVGERVTMTISPPRFPQYAGTYELLKSGEDPPTWEGFYKDKAGARQKVRLHLVKE